MCFLQVATFSTRATEAPTEELGNSSNLNVGNVGFVAVIQIMMACVLFIQYRPIVPRKTAQQRANGGSILSQFINNAAGTPPEYLPELGPYGHDVPELCRRL